VSRTEVRPTGRASRRLSADEGHLDLVQPGRLAGALLGVAVRALDPCRGDRGADVIVGCAGAHETAQVAARGGEEAGVQAAVSGEPGPGAVGAERLGDRGDDADLPGSVGVPPALGDLAP